MGRQVRSQKPDKLTPEDLAGPEGWYGVPALTGGYASRPRLTALLDARPDTPLVVISAPAGTGKTSVTAEWVSGFADSSRTAWVTFDLRDPMFWPAFVACLRRLGAPVPEAGPPDHASTVDRQFLLALATGLAGLPERVTVVVDGYELVDRAVAKDVDFLLRHSGHRLRLVILTRADPLLPLYRYRLEEQITELRIADLAFTDEEAARLLTTSGARLTPSSVRTLNARTGGWAVGLRFAARVIATREQPDEAVEEVTGDEGNIAEYLLGEVLSAQPPEIRQLLLSTSVPDTLRPGLTEEMGGRSAGRTLALLTKGNAFIEPVPEHAGFYRYHPFFRDMLRAELAFESPDLMDELQRRAAEWYAREGFVVEAVSHFASIDAWTDAAAELVDELAVGELLLGTTSSPLAKVVGGLPGDLVTPAACVVRAVLARLEGEAELFSEQLDLAELTAQPEGGHPARAVSLTIDVLKVIRARGAGDARATLQLAERAERSLNARENRVQAEQHPELAGLVLAARGDADAREGHLARGYDSFAAAAAAASAPGAESLLLECLGQMAVLACFGGQVSRAESMANRSVELADSLGLADAERPSAAASALAWVSVERDQLRAGSERIATAQASGLRDPVADTLLTVASARLQAGRGDVEGALAAVEDMSGRLEQHPWMKDRLSLEKGHLRVVGGDPAVALLDVEDVRSSGSAPQVALVGAQASLELGDDHTVADLLASALDRDAPLATQIEGWLVEAARQLRSGSSMRARSALARALRIAARDGLRRPFRQAPDDVQKLLADDRLLQEENPWLDGRRRRAGSRRIGRAELPGQRARYDDGSMPVVDKLTAKELEVLGHLAELLTTEEIASAMFVSVNTIRTHVRSILRKLGVSRRNAAVRRARELALLPDTASSPLPGDVRLGTRKENGEPVA